MDVIPFQHTLPYERQFEDIYVSSCPFCEEEQVLTHMKPRDYKQAIEGVKTILIMPCCRSKITILEADDDYFWADEPLRK
ncbi:hypothetical protein M3689_19940 [Alkalihalophilus marmarensis]|jgi:hypothetical protein|uniref:Uncharacterized protein n=1 Tax=Alkalihalophilus marmarensis DSM 21297 TaxID=1188261 RepID=U6SMR8_9BACI|nr:hypothetical protein [Alkalihalophilus marmarensis]ERN52220.1 hypothetical protein A33I_17075 [Alkalihalophilus marmarensis DSM 21297]MCM3491564.1 hypothetical protein [Alkalihalophilus marmarensis]